MVRQLDFLLASARREQQEPARIIPTPLPQYIFKGIKCSVAPSVQGYEDFIFSVHLPHDTDFLNSYKI